MNYNPLSLLLSLANGPALVGLAAAWVLLMASGDSLTQQGGGGLPVDPNYLIQVPVLGAFIWFTLRITRDYLEAQKFRDKQLLEFMAEMRESTNKVIDCNTRALERIADEVRANTVTLSKHDARVGVGAFASAGEVYTSPNHTPKKD